MVNEDKARERRGKGFDVLGMKNESSLPTNVGSNNGLGVSVPKRHEGGRIVGGCSLHVAEIPGGCQPYHHPCPAPRCVDCCGVAEDQDIMECPRCGKQWTARCTFDEDYS